MTSRTIALTSLGAIALSLAARLIGGVSSVLVQLPLVAAILVGGAPMLWALSRRVVALDFGSDLLAGLSVITAIALREWLVADVVILMWSGGQALEERATQRASRVLKALATRSPTRAHRRTGEALVDIPLDDVRVGDAIVVLPHETCPVDGIVQGGVSSMDESFVSGEPFQVSKTVGAPVISGAINGDGALTIVAGRRAVDSRYARIMRIVAEAEANRPPLRRLADRLGAWYTPLAVAIALLGWVLSGDPARGLAVLVIATPCPLLLAIPIAIIGAISLGATRGILIKDPALLERITTCRTVVFDKTGTLTLGRPMLTSIVPLGGADAPTVLGLAASLERYSKHPLSAAVVAAALSDAIDPSPVSEVHERPGEGLIGRVADHLVRITGRTQLAPGLRAALPLATAGLECVVLIDERVAAILLFHDAPRRESESFVRHLGPSHRVNRALIVSGDREPEVRYLAKAVGISEVYAAQSPENKVDIVRKETAAQPTLFIGDGLNDAPAMIAATAGVALGQQYEATSEAAGAVILEGSLSKVDELLHIARRTRRIALQSAVGGMVVSVAGMALAVAGWLPPLAGVVTQEIIDVAAVLNAVRASFAPPDLTDF